MNITSADIEAAAESFMGWAINAILTWMASPNFFNELFTAVVWVAILRVVWKVMFWSIRKLRKRHQRRMARAFAADMRANGFRRAGGQCEFSNGLTRCRNRAEHADHFYPFTHGGATSMQNLVAACSGHNLSKGAKIPSQMEKARIEARRKAYFPALASVKAGEWARKAKVAV